MVEEELNWVYDSESNSDYGECNCLWLQHNSFASSEESAATPMGSNINWTCSRRIDCRGKIHGGLRKHRLTEIEFKLARD